LFQDYFNFTTAAALRSRILRGWGYGFLYLQAELVLQSPDTFVPWTYSCKQ